MTQQEYETVLNQIEDAFKTLFLLEETVADDAWTVELSDTTNQLLDSRASLIKHIEKQGYTAHWDRMGDVWEVMSIQS